MSETLTVDELTFEVRRSPRRRTVEIIVDRQGELVIAAPPGIDDTVMTDFVREKQFWIFSKLAEKEALRQPIVAKEFVSGEGFPYLGRSYRLLLVDEQEVALKLEGGRFKLRRVHAPKGGEHFITWYTTRGRPWLKKRIAGWASRMDVGPSAIEIRDLGFRWGSCGQQGTVNFHWAIMQLSPSVVDYVIVHELAHLREPNHTHDFWRRVERAMPDFEERKAWLAGQGARTVGL